MKKILSFFAALATLSAPVARAADCATLQQYFSAYGEAQNAENSYDYFGKLNDSLQQFNNCVGWAWRLQGTGSDAVAQAIRDCEDQYNLEVSTIETDYWPLHDETVITSQIYYDYLTLTIIENLQCF